MHSRDKIRFTSHNIKEIVKNFMYIHTYEQHTQLFELTFLTLDNGLYLDL